MILKIEQKATIVAKIKRDIILKLAMLSKIHSAIQNQKNRLFQILRAINEIYYPTLLMESQLLNIEGVDITLFRSNRARSINITIKPFSGVRVSVPQTVSFNKAKLQSRELLGLGLISQK